MHLLFSKAHINIKNVTEEGCLIPFGETNMEIDSTRLPDKLLSSIFLDMTYYIE
jgi:hypothetical protein